MTDIAVIIPCFNLGRFVAEAVESVLHQSRPAEEVVIVDDGSTDLYTRERLASLLYPRTRVFRTQNRGVSAARNHGIRATTAKYLVTLDADDRLDPEYLSQTAATLDADPDISFVSTAIRAFGAADYTWTPPPYTLVNALVRGAGHPASMFRRNVWTAVGGFDESPALQGCEDLDFWISAMEHGFRGEVIGAPLLEYRVRRDSLHQSLVSGGGQRAVMAAVFRKHRRTVETIGPVLLIEKDRFIEDQRNYEAAAVDRRAMLERQREALQTDIARLTAELAPRGAPLLDWGDIGTREPVRPVDSADRRMSLQEFYASAFLRAHADDCRGTVLEIRPPEDVVLAPADVKGSEPVRRATSLAEISDVAAGEFDCIVIGDALRTAYDPLASLRDLSRALRPGGVLLSLLPAARAVTGSRLGDADYWRFTEAAARHLFANVFPAEAILVTGYGNVMICAAALAGLPAEEMEPAERDFVDPMFPLMYGVRAVKA